MVLPIRTVGVPTPQPRYGAADPRPAAAPAPDDEAAPDDVDVWPEQPPPPAAQPQAQPQAQPLPPRQPQRGPDIEVLYLELQDAVRDVERGLAGFRTFDGAFRTVTRQLREGERPYGVPVLRCTGTTGTRQVDCVVDLHKVAAAQLPGVLLAVAHTQYDFMRDALAKAGAAIDGLAACLDGPE